MPSSNRISHKLQSGSTYLGVSRRTFLQTSAALFTTAAVSACIPAAPGTGSGGTDGADAEAVSLIHLHRGGDYLNEVVQSQADAYHEMNPNVTVEIDRTPTGSNYDKLLLNIAANTVPDSWFASPSSSGLAWHKDIAVSLEPYFEAEPGFSDEDFIETAWVGSTYGGERVGVPWDSGALMVLVNFKPFEEAGIDIPDPSTPLTWDELLELGTALTIDFDGNHPDQANFDPTRVQRYGFGFRDAYLFPWLWTNDAEIIAADGTMPIDTPEAIEAIQFAADLGAKHFIAPSPAYQQSTEISLQTDSLTMHWNGVWMLGRLNDAGLDWGALPFPMSKTPASYGHYSPLMLVSQSEHNQEAFDFIYWACCSNEGETILVETGMMQPIRRDLTDLFVNNPQPPAKEYRQAFIDAFDPATFRYPGDTMGSFMGGYFGILMNDLLRPALDPVWSGEIQYADIASDLRQKAEQVLETGELA